MAANTQGMMNICNTKITIKAAAEWYTCTEKEALLNYGW
jgi:hypothetical protein